MLKKKSAIKARLADNYGKVNEKEFSYEEYENIAHFFHKKEETETEEHYIDDITWNDVDMDKVFLDINNTNSSVGQEYLYYLLRKTNVSDEELKERDRVMEFFDKEEEKRLEIGHFLYKIGYAVKISLCHYIDNLFSAPKTSNVVHFLSNLFVIGSLIYMLFVDAAIGMCLFFLSAGYTIVTYYKYKAEVESYFTCVKYIVKMADAAKKITKLSYPELEKYNQSLNKSLEKIEPALKGSGILSDSRTVDGSLLEVILDYVRMLTHADLISFNSISESLSKCTDEIYNIYENLGYLEAMIASASYRRLLPYYSKPEFCNEKRLCAKEIFHPLIVNPVSNSIDVNKCVLITGSNASGKSTFLKSVAINAILSQTICTSVTKQYTASKFRIYSSIALSDNLSGGESYYMVEIKSLKRIVEAAKNSDMPVLCFVDEVLRGTNTVERIAASSQILGSFSKTNTICFAATHDIELTMILSEKYKNFHFREEVVDNDIKFNYALYSGPATTKNAIKLLGIIGYDKSIIDASEAMANNFIRTGEWQKMEGNA